MERQQAEEIRRAVRKNYGKVAQGQQTALHSRCSGETCCATDQIADWRKTAAGLGYSEKEIDRVPEGSNMGLGCGNPLALASLQPGETVLDLGSGGGFDCFLAARAVGESGHVIGVDMTAEMVSKAREAADKAGFGNVEFRLGEIENLPVADESVDVILSNCVINLSPEKDKVFGEAFRVLKKGGRLTVADVVATAALPEDLRNDLELRCGCIGGAEEVEKLGRLLHTTGFEDVRIELVPGSESVIAGWFPGKDLGSTLASARIEAVKPRQATESPGNETQIKKKVYENYRSGFHCAEVVAKTILEIFSPTQHTEAIRAASGFGGGIAGSMQELCGAYTGGIIAIGALLGRDNPGEDLRESATIIKKYTDRFTGQFGSKQCMTALESFGGKPPKGCIRLTAEAALILNGVLREWEEAKGVRLREQESLPRAAIGLGECPFSSGEQAVDVPGRPPMPLNRSFSAQ